VVTQLRERGDVTVLEKVRYVRDGNLVTSAGVSAGIDMSLWLVGQLHGPDHARLTQKMMEYDPAPPYAAEV
jgi:transcriptional regulator GlxA family with amidase domain